MESALRDSEEFSSSLLYNSPYPVVVVNPDSSIRYVNPALEKLTGFTAAELIGKKLPYPWWPEETLEKTSQDLQKGMSNETTRVEQLFRTKNGERFWVEITSIAVKREGEFKYYVAAWVDITERKRLKENMQFYISEIIMAQEEERKRIARELHDDTAQSLAVLSLNIDVILEHKFELPDDTTRRLVELRQGTIDTLDNLRRFSRELRPDILDQAGLVSALELLTQDLMNVGGIDSYLELRGEERRLSADAELLMFRIAQEAMHNIRKHSQATEARVVVEFTRETARLTVNDNGKGFEVPDDLGDLASRGRLGLVGMRERARLLNANFSVRSEVGKGTTLMVELAI
jgi:PAS domain S-box-containing protein